MKDIEQHGMVIFVNNNILDNGTGITIHNITLDQLVGYVHKERIGNYSMSTLMNQAKNQSSHVLNQAKI
jgi:hypothetical protein